MCIQRLCDFCIDNRQATLLHSDCVENTVHAANFGLERVQFFGLGTGNVKFQNKIKGKPVIYNIWKNRFAVLLPTMYGSISEIILCDKIYDHDSVQFLNYTSRRISQAQ
jgi:hypothetical protein